MEAIYLETLLHSYSNSFKNKVFREVEEVEPDLLMEVFGINAILKNANRQYWGRELGKCWELLLLKTFQASKPDFFNLPRRIDGAEPYDFQYKHFGIDAKYRVGSGDSKTLKLFKANGDIIRNEGMEPMALFLRQDNLRSAMGNFRKGEWIVLQGQETFDFVHSETSIDLKKLLTGYRDKRTFNINIM
jgi:hypothetical protein